jgi:hypothetical protein
MVMGSRSEIKLKAKHQMAARQFEPRAKGRKKKFCDMEKVCLPALFLHTARLERQTCGELQQRNERAEIPSNAERRKKFPTFSSFRPSIDLSLSPRY